MDLNQRIDAFSRLGSILRDSLETRNNKYSVRLLYLIETQHQKNPWFTPENIKMAVRAIADELTTENLTRWTNLYPALNQYIKPVTVGVVMAGNIPLVGFHDFLSVLITGNNIVAKTSSKDPDLIVFIGNILCDIDPGFKDKIRFTGETIKGFDVAIATGSDNSSRYFEYYFGKYPNIIRKNRNSIAILDGKETGAELEALGGDIFSYFGLGCRNVSKIYIPSNYDLSLMTRNWGKFSGVIKHRKYANNYDFSKAVYLVNRENFTDTGFVLLKESDLLSSPVAVLYYEYYNSSEHIVKISEDLKGKIQCIVGINHITFGKAQSPALWDYADGTDTIEFLLKKNIAGIL
jgi:hypothetical protein